MSVIVSELQALYDNIELVENNIKKDTVTQQEVTSFQEALIMFYMNNLSRFAILPRKNFFYYQKKLGRAYIKQLPNLEKEAVDAYFFFLYKLEIIGMDHRAFKEMIVDIKFMLSFYIDYFMSKKMD